MRTVVTLLLLCIGSNAQIQGVYSGKLGATTAGTVATPTDSPGAGTYSSTQSVTLSDSTSGSSIIYTTNGSTPACPSTGTTYSGAISVSVTTTIKAIGCKSGLTDSGLLTSVYTISAGSPITFVDSTAVDDQAVPGNDLLSTDTGGGGKALNIAVGNKVYIYGKVTGQCFGDSDLTLADDASVPNTYTLQGHVIISSGFACYAHWLGTVTTAKTGVTFTLHSSTSYAGKGMYILITDGGSGAVDSAPAIVENATGSGTSITSGNFGSVASGKLIVYGVGNNTFTHTFTGDTTDCNGGAFPALVHSHYYYAAGSYCITTTTSGPTVTATIDSATTSIGIGALAIH